MKEKSSLRKAMRTLLGGVTAQQIAEASEQICQHLRQSNELLGEVDTVTTFSARMDEIDLSALHQFLPEKKLLYPLCHRGGILTFHHVPHPAELIPGMLGILEPLPEQHPEVSVENIDLFLCPGLAFGIDGSRLGHGGGFYDRALARKKTTARAVGIGLELQILDSVPCDDHDIKVDHLITKHGINKVP